MQKFEDKSANKADITNKAAWVDDEDENIKINLNKSNRTKKLIKNNENQITGSEFQNRLRNQYMKLNSHSDIYKWAFDKENNDNENAERNDNEKQSSLGNILKSDKEILENKESKDSNTIKVIQLNDINMNSKSNSIISSLEFNPQKKNLVFTAGLDRKLKLFSINELENKSIKVHSTHLSDMPIFSAKHINDGTEIILSGRRKHFYIYNLEASKLDRCASIFTHKDREISSLERMFVGKNQFAFGSLEGYVLLYDSKSKTYKHDLKINGSVNSVCFDNNDTYLYTVGDQSEIHVFDLRKYRNCVQKVSDLGNFNTTCMDISNDNGFLATSSNSGVVNLYNLEDFHSGKENIEPIRNIMNLTTSVEFLKFNKRSNTLGIASRWKKNAFRLFNINNNSVYSNFPALSTKMKYPICFDYSNDDSYLSIGNDEGRALLFKFI